MRWFSAHRETSIASGRVFGPRRSIFRSAIFALACLAGVGFSVGAPFEARAGDDGGMMSFLLSGNRGGRARATAPSVHFAAPAMRAHAPSARRFAVARQKARTARSTRLALAHKRTKSFERASASGSANSLIQKASLNLDVASVHARPVSESLALKAAAAAARPEDAHLRDKTLRSGDVVATSNGLKVFRGSEQFPHRASDFVPVARAQNIAQRTVLEALDRSLRGIRTVARTQKARIIVAKAPEQPAAGGNVRPTTPALRTVAMSYAPKADSNAKPDAPAMQAIERIVRRVDASAPVRPSPATAQGRGGETVLAAKKSE